MKEFNLLGHTIEFDDNLEYYSEVRKFYSNIMDHVLEIYEKSWNESCGNIHAVMLMFPASVEVITKQLAKVACDRLIAQYIYDMDEDIFCSYYEDEYFKTPSFDDIYEVYMTALEIMNGDTLSRNNRKIDFDELTDEVANFVYNRYEEGKSSSKQKRPMNRLEREFEKEFEKLYTEELYENLKDDIRCLCLGGMHAYLNELCDHDMFEYPDLDYEKSDTIYLNTLKHAEGEVAIRNLIKCIRLYPLRAEYYITLYNMASIDDEAARTIEEMVETLDMYGEFYNATIEMRVKRWQTRFLNLINENKNATIVEKAEIVKRFFAEEYYRCDFYDDKDGKKILEYINTQVKAISEEILKYGKGSDTKEKLEFYCKENNLSDEEKLNFDIVLCSYEIIDKYPFFIVLDEEDYYLKSTDEYMDLLELIEKLCEKIEDEALTSIPDIVSGKIEDGLLKTWMMDIHTVEKIEAFSLVHEKFKIVFEKEVIDSDQIKNKKKNAEKTESCLSEIKKIYDNILSNGQSINLNVFEEFIKDIKKYKLNESLSPEVRSYKQKIINAFIDYCESKPVEELLGIQDILLKYDDDYITNEPEWVIDLYSNKLKSSYSFLTIMKYGKTSSLLILEDLYEKESSRKILELKIKAEELYAQLKKYPGYYSKKSKLFDTSVKTLVSYCDDKVSENDICAVYMSEALSFLVTKEGFVCLRGSESKDVRYIKYSDIKYINQMEGGFVCLVLKEGNEKIMFTDAGEKDTVSDLFEFISEFLIYLYDLPTGYFNLYKYKKQIDEVAGLMKGIEKKNIEQLNRILKDLKKYPKKISEEAIEKVQKIYDERAEKVKKEFQNALKGNQNKEYMESIIAEADKLSIKFLFDNYDDKTEEELESILKVFGKILKNSSEHILPYIEKLYNEKVNVRKQTELDDIISDYHDLNIHELENLLLKLNEEYKEVSSVNGYIQKVSDRLMELANTELGKMRTDDDNLSYMELIKKHDSILSDTKLSEYIKKTYTKELMKKIIDRREEIVSVLHSDIKKAIDKICKKIKGQVEFVAKNKIEDVETKTSIKSENWHERPIILIRDVMENGIHEVISHKSINDSFLWGIIFTSDRIVLKDPSKSYSVKIRQNTRFTVKKKWMSTDLMLDGINVNFTAYIESESDPIVVVLNKILDIIRQSEFHQMNIKQLVAETEKRTKNMVNSVSVTEEQSVQKVSHQEKHQISLSKSEPDKQSEKNKLSLEKETSGEQDLESADKVLNSENISGDDIALSLHNEIKNAGNKKIIKFVEFLTKGSILEGKSSFVSKYIYDELCDKDKVDSDDIPIVRIRDSVSQSMYEADAESLEGILIMSNKVIYYKDAKYVTVPISSSTEFHIKKKWLGSELRLNDVNIDYALDEAYDEEDFAKFLNKVLDIIRKSEFHQTSKETSDVTNESVSEGMTDIAPKTDNKLGMMSQVKHSCSEAVNFVNNLPSEMRAKIIGTANPKFSKKVKNAIKAYASNVKESEVIALYDDTVFGSAKEGFIMTTDRIIVRYSATTSNCMYSEIKGFEINYNARLSLTSINIQTLNGLTKISGVMDEAECKVMANGINEIVKYLYGLDENPYSIEIN